MRAMLTILAAAALLQNDPPRPAFLDSRTQIKVWLEQPIAESDPRPKIFNVRIGERNVPIQKIELAGEPERERLLPRTPGRVILAGTLQQALGGKPWDPDGDLTQMTEVQPGVHELVVKLPKGAYEYKVTVDGSWNENYGQNFVRGGANLSITIREDDTLVRFRVDRKNNRILNSYQNSEEVDVPTEADLPKREKTAADRFPMVVLTLATPISDEQIDDPMTVDDGLSGKQRPVFARDVLNDPAFVYSRDDLGARWSKTATSFKVWSPVSERAEVLLFPSQGSSPEVIPMRRGTAGVWYAKATGDLHGRYYQYRFWNQGQSRVATDLYSFAASKDSKRSMVVDLDRTDPSGGLTGTKLRHKNQSEAVLYEIHVRDFTVHPSSGVTPKQRGKYLGLVQRGTKVPGTNIKTGLDYMVDLGVTDIHILPIHNFLTGSDDEYTWGYATNLFNVPEENYSSQPNNPVEVIREFKQMMNGVHQGGLRVILDVVYNHTWPPEGADSNFWQTVPYYYFRTNDRGDVLNESGVGNALADERPMARKFVQDSLLYWMREYKVDGFRFDLLGMHRPESVRQWAAAMRAERPDVVLYGEPWTGGGPTYFPKGAQRGLGIAVFNDRFRGAFRGELDGPGAGFISGGRVDREALMRAIAGHIDGVAGEGFTDSPAETVNYISAHDNLTLWDKLALAMPRSSRAAQEQAVRLGHAAVLLSYGLPFLEGGPEIGRTKGGNHNSYNAGDAVNQYDWQRGVEFQALAGYVEGLIDLRRHYDLGEASSSAFVRQSLQWIPVEGNAIAYQMKTAKATAVVVLNGDASPRSVTLPAGTWQQKADATRAGLPTLRTASGQITVPGLSAAVFVRD